MGQQPLTFVRQLLAVCLDTALLRDDAIPEDVKDRARAILQDAKGHSLGEKSPGSLVGLGLGTSTCK